MPKHLDYYQTPSGQLLMQKVAQDMAGITTRLDEQRALAYANGVAPIYSDDVPAPRRNPWATHESLVCDLAEGLARVNILRQPMTRRYIGDDLQARADRLYSSICDQANLLVRAGALEAFEHPKLISERYRSHTASMKTILAHYERIPLATVPSAQIAAHERLAPDAGKFR